MTTAPTLPDFSAFIGRTVLVAGGGSVIGANGTTTIEAIDGDTLWLRSGKSDRRPVSIARIEKATLFPEKDTRGTREERP